MGDVEDDVEEGREVGGKLEGGRAERSCAGGGGGKEVGSNKPLNSISWLWMSWSMSGGETEKRTS